MNNRIFSIIGWIGTALVVAALGIWFLSTTSRALPAQWDQYRFYLALAGLVCMLIYMISQWRDVAKLFSRRQAQYGTLAASRAARSPRSKALARPTELCMPRSGRSSSARPRSAATA